ncbi:MAG: hypothetical protein QOH14_2187 [Pseudonocardiales bacterium]|nr:hypothetical protein [Pseudonocardiales bacterium]
MADDVERWLAAARPHTAADEGWAASPAGEEMLAGIHRAAHVPRPVRLLHRPPRRWVGSLSLAVGAAVVVLVVTLGGSVPVQHQPGPGVLPGPLIGPRPAAMALAAYDSCADMLAGLRAHTAAHVGPYGLPAQQPSFTYNAALPAGPPMPSSAAAAPAPVEHSTTNVQEAGVDEPDIVKTDGTRVVTVTAGVLRVTDTATRKVTGSLDLTLYANWQSAQLLVAGDRALVVLDSGSGYSYGYGPIPSVGGRFGGSVAGPSGGPIGVPGSTSSAYILVDLAGQPTVLGTFRPTGGYVDARMTGSTVRLVVTSSPKISFPDERRPAASDAQRVARNRAAVEKSPLDAWLPGYEVTTGGATTKHTVPCQRVSHPVDYTGAAMLTIYTIDLAKGLGDTQPLSLAADGDTVYATSGSLYVASNPSWWSCFGRCKASSANSEQTEIHRFDITGDSRPTYLGSGSVPGRLLSQYSLSDYDGHLRIATTSGQRTGNTATAVYVLDAATLKVTGQVGGLGKGEQIYAVRFLGPLGYVVTFRQTDPLFVVDLSDPSAPRAVGELTITGYSDYLHPVGDGRLVGVGQEANAQGRVAGMQVSLFDVSKPAAPRRLAHVVRGDAPGEQRLDPHAFLYWPSSGLLVVPIQSWQAAESGKVLVIKIRGDGLDTVGTISNPAMAGTGYPGPGIERSLVIAGDIWTLSDAGLRVSDQTSLARQAWIPFS